MIRFLTFSGGFTIVQSIVFFKDSLYPLFWLNICVCFVVFLQMNAAFLINIVRLLVTKLRQMPEVVQTKYEYQMFQLASTKLAYALLIFL